VFLERSFALLLSKASLGDIESYLIFSLFLIVDIGMVGGYWFARRGLFRPEKNELTLPGSFFLWHRIFCVFSLIKVIMILFLDVPAPQFLSREAAARLFPIYPFILGAYLVFVYFLDRKPLSFSGPA